MKANQNKNSYGIRAALTALLVLLVYLAAFFLFANLEKTTNWMGFGFAVLALLLTGGGLWLGIMASDSLQTAVNLYEALRPLWVYPVLAIILSLVCAALPQMLWKLLLFLEILLLAGAAVFTILGVSAAMRMTELDRQQKGGRNS